jgi:hypothetical protein
MLRKLLEWKEPKEFLEALDKIEEASEKPWHRPVMAIIVFATCLLLWWSALFEPTKTPPPLAAALSLGCVYALFLAWGAPWINSRCSSKVRLFKKRVVRVRGSSNLSLPYKAFRCYYWLSNEHFSTLILVRQNTGRFISIGAPDKDIREQVTVILNAAGVKEAEDSEKTTHLESRPLIINWKRILIHLTASSAILIGTVLLIINNITFLIKLGPWAFLTLLAVLGLPILYLVLVMKISQFLQKKPSEISITQ